ncbi:unnamed protein product [Ostreobium quekettii]|uniref:Uncharacterized protein n=1 Tax=Ostreobium quekettii TaxID=121088 RepID=A0A8S1INF8_9CHLO|nr:unnamed protein product [Ostreobium quekettii]
MFCAWWGMSNRSLCSVATPRFGGAGSTVRTMWHVLACAVGVRNLAGIGAEIRQVLPGQRHHFDSITDALNWSFVRHLGTAGIVWAVALFILVLVIEQDSFGPRVLKVTNQYYGLRVT